MSGIVIQFDYTEYTDKSKSEMSTAIAAFEKELSSVRTGRVTPDLINPVKVMAYGSKTPISQIANVNLIDAKTLHVNVWDKSLLSDVEKGIRDAGLGLSPVVDGTTVKIYLPPLTEERRDDLTKLVNKYLENYKIEIRRMRRDTLEVFKKHKKDSGITEDDFHMYNKKFEDIVSGYISQLEKLADDKNKELKTL